HCGEGEDQTQDLQGALEGPGHRWASPGSAGRGMIQGDAKGGPRRASGCGPVFHPLPLPGRAHGADESSAVPVVRTVDGGSPGWGKEEEKEPRRGLPAARADQVLEGLGKLRCGLARIAELCSPRRKPSARAEVSRGAGTRATNHLRKLAKDW